MPSPRNNDVVQFMRSNRHRPSFSWSSFSAILLLAGPTLAAELPISGSYGNRDGCAYARTGQATGSGDFFLLTSEAVTTAAASCKVTEVIAKPDNGFAAAVNCEKEGGGDELAPFEIGIESATADGYVLKIDDGSTWGPLALCK